MKSLGESSCIIHSSTKFQLDFSWVSPPLHSPDLPAVSIILLSLLYNRVASLFYINKGLIKVFYQQSWCFRHLWGLLKFVLCCLFRHSASTSLSRTNSTHFSLRSHSSPIPSLGSPRRVDTMITWLRLSQSEPHFALLTVISLGTGEFLLACKEAQETAGWGL